MFFSRIVRRLLLPFVKLYFWLERRRRLRRPDMLFAELIGEVTILKYKITFPPVVASDTKDREVTTAVTKEDGTVVEPTVKSYPAGDASFEATFDRNDQVSLTLVDIDGSGNRSVPSEAFTFTATDTIAPPQPGQFAVELLSDEQ